MQTYFGIVGGLDFELTLVAIFIPQAILWLILKCMKIGSFQPTAWTTLVYIFFYILYKKYKSICTNNKHTVYCGSFCYKKWLCWL